MKRHLQEAFRRYGLPDQILCDNGPSWNCPGHRQALGRLEAWRVRVGVDVIHGRLYHAQNRGKEERFHETLDVDLLRTRPSWASHEECDAAFDPFRQLYNEERPHDALGGRAPIERIGSRTSVTPVSGLHSKIQPSLRLLGSVFDRIGATWDSI